MPTKYEGGHRSGLFVRNAPSKKLTNAEKGAINSPHNREPEPVKLAPLRFLEHRFDWEKGMK